jgi:hypothetical protein
MDFRARVGTKINRLKTINSPPYQDVNTPETTYTWVTPQQIKIPKHFSHIQKAGPDAINTLTTFNIAWRIVFQL